MATLSEYENVREQAADACEDGVGFANGVAELTLEPGLLDDPQYGAEGGDMLAIPDTDSVRPVAWADDTAAVFADLINVDGTRFDLCARSALRGVLDDLESEGYRAMAGVESEFSLLSPDGDGGWEPYNDRCSYDLSAVDTASELITDWTDAMEAAGHDVLGVHQESQPGQYEVNLAYDDALTTADGICFFRHMLKSVTRRTQGVADAAPLHRGGRQRAAFPPLAVEP
jgi:glutamine synthetase